jgi:stress response protein YsnF
VVTGKVRVGTELEVVNEVASAILEEQQVTVMRVPVNRLVTEVPHVRTEGEVTIIPVVEEIMVVEKRLVLKEELHIRRHVTTEQVEVPVTLKKQRAVIERVEVEPQNQEHHRDGYD